MKKFYILAFAAAVTISASAVAPLSDIRQLPAVDNEIVSAGDALLKSALPKADALTSADDIAGTYTWNYLSLLENETGMQQSEVMIFTDGMDEGKVLIKMPMGYVEGIVDTDAATLTIPTRQYITLYENYKPVYLYFKSADEEGNLISGANGESAVGIIKGSKITFPERCIFAIGFPEEESLGYYHLSYSNEFIDINAAEVDEFEDGWTDYCSAIFTDGWVICAYYTLDAEGNREYYNPARNAWEVTVQKNDSDPYLYRIYDPYNAPTRPLKFGDGGKGAIVYSIEDPDFVLVYPSIYSGYTTRERRINCFNLEGFYSAKGMSKADIISGITNYKKSYVDGDLVFFNQCRINWPGQEVTGYVWNQDVVSMMHGSLALITSGVENVSVEADNSPVEYYNLQGVRELNPTNGVYIKRQGSRVTKLVIR